MKPTKIAYIDNRLQTGETYSYIEDILEYAAKNLIQLDSSWRIDYFEEDHGSLNAYDGLIMHLGIDNQKKLDKITKKYPDIKIALISHAPFDYNEDYPEEGKVKMFRADSTEEFFDYFKN